MSLGHAAISAFPWSLGVHISAIPLGDAIAAGLKCIYRCVVDRLA